MLHLYCLNRLICRDIQYYAYFSGTIAWDSERLTIVSPYECITISVSNFVTHMLFGLLKCDVHIAIQARQYT
jgi:hypothetical protein